MINTRTLPSTLAIKLLVLLFALPIALLFVTQSSGADAMETRFLTLDEAVAAGRLDAEVATALKANGSAEAFVTISDKDLLPESVRSMPVGQARIGKVLASTSEKLATRKAETMSNIGSEAESLTEYNNLAISLVRFSSTRSLLRALNDERVTGVRRVGGGTVELAQSLPMVNQPQSAAAGFRGNGTYVAVLDTGVNYTNSAFGTCTAPNVPTNCVVFYAQDFAPSDGVLDDNGHGTNVAGIVAGVAPGTRIFALDVFRYNATKQANEYSDPEVVNAINAVIQWKKQGYNIRAINMSLGEDPSQYAQSCTASAYTTVFAQAREADIIPVIAAGNGGSKTSVAMPACTPGALSVGAVYDDYLGLMAWKPCTDFNSAPNQVPCFSQSGPTLGMLAPGSCITAGGIRDCMSGTSQAAPHVAGAVAVLAAAKPLARAADIQAALVGSGPALTDSNAITRNRLDVFAALKALGVGTGGGSADKTAPVLTAPFQEIQFGSAASTVPVRVSWSATDASGIAQYKVMASINGGAFADQLPANSTSTSKTFALAPGSNYRFIAAAQDKAGNWSGWSYGPTFTIDGVYQDSNTAVKYAGTWTRSAWGSASGGTVTVANTPNASATFTFTGRNVAWIASKATSRGQAYVYLDGTYNQTIDLYSSTNVAQPVVFWANWPTSGTHTIKVVVVGTTGRPSVDVDGFVVIR